MRQPFEDETAAAITRDTPNITSAPTAACSRIKCDGRYSPIFIEVPQRIRTQQPHTQRIRTANTLILLVILKACRERTPTVGFYMLPSPLPHEGRLAEFAIMLAGMAHTRRAYSGRAALGVGFCIGDAIQAD